MTKNGKIAVGCGIAGCLGLILVVIVVVVLGVLGYVAIPGIANSNYNSNDNYNSNSNNNSNTNSDSNTNANSNTSSDASSSSSSSMSEDDKHKLFQAAGVTKDTTLILRVLEKIGFPNGTGDGYPDFMKEHFPWAMRNASFVQSINSPTAARAYVDEHIDD